MEWLFLIPLLCVCAVVMGGAGGFDGFSGMSICANCGHGPEEHADEPGLPRCLAHVYDRNDCTCPGFMA